MDVSIEAPFVKIVQESIVKSKIRLLVTKKAFKSHKKFIEKEVSNCVNKITQAKKAAANPAAAIGALDALIAKLNDLKQKVSLLFEPCIQYASLVEAEDRLFTVMRKRLAHLQQVFEGAAS